MTQRTTRPQARWIGPAAAVLTAGASACLAQTRQRYLLIDRDLRAETVELVSIDEGQVECLRSGLIDRRPMSDLLALLVVDDDNPRFGDDDRVVELADGQRWVGAPAPSPLSEQLGWKVDRVGTLAAPLDQILSARLLSGARLLAFDPRADGDRLLLSNGDLLSGLLVSISEQVEFEVFDSSEVTRLPLSQAASLALANVRQRPSGTMLWLADGSVMRVDRLRWSPAALQFTTSAGSVECNMETDMLRGVSFAAERLMPLADLTPTVARDSTWLNVIEPPVVLNPRRAVGLSDVQMRGPIEVTYDLPPGAMRLAATATVPQFVAQWADLELTVLVDDRIAFEAGMDGIGRSRREIDIPLNGASRLTIRIGEGARGPIQDVIILQRPMLLFD